MQLTKDDNKYRKDMFEVCPINEDPHFYYANFFLQRAPEYNKLIELHKEDFLGRIVGALQAYDFKALANAEDKSSVNVTLESIEFTQSGFKPQDLNAETVDAVMRLCAIGFYICFRVAVENPTDLDIMMFFQAKDEDVHTNMTYSLDANTDWGNKQGYRFMDIETYFAMYNTALPRLYPFEELHELCHAFKYVCEFNEDNFKTPFSQYTVSKEFIREHRKWCLYLLYFARKAWELTSEDDKKELIVGTDITEELPVFAQKKYKDLYEDMQEVSFGDYSTHDVLYERFFVLCIAFEALREKIAAKHFKSKAE